MALYVRVRMQTGPESYETVEDRHERERGVSARQESDGGLTIIGVGDWDREEMDYPSRCIAFYPAGNWVSWRED